MTIYEANKIRRDFYKLTNPTEEDKFLYTEALDFLISETKKPEYMVELGGMYYEERHFDLALKYYELAVEYGDLRATTNLGYIWYYGRTGEKNYEKAFYYYDKARRMGDPIAAYKVADMYKNGYCVEKDCSKYKEIIEELYPLVKDTWNPYDPLSEVFTRLARIRSEEGNTEEALRLYDRARAMLERRIQDHPFFGDRNIMKWLVEDTYALRAFDPDDFSLYDLFYLLRKPAKVRFRFAERIFEVRSEEEEGGCAVFFEERWYRAADDFFAEAGIDGELLTTIYDELYDFEVC